MSQAVSSGAIGFFGTTSKLMPFFVPKERMTKALAIALLYRKGPKWSAATRCAAALPMSIKIGILPTASIF